ncbi:hypothetical protein OCGS_2491 [Oceaniovalibus guishaninsula JLT2003]|uniref:TIGR01620 family protein n=1 Tax=Oceaniovalibus guishaninsula JLT2003 TaxID=1231392 RepID=K2H745_9RHOB|nr:TIGR01620 family protein [Oceaniovalibus guishaninsula]EKE43453.1 hypothetical protein OCGS_2491 [Oceaniovalibus guishaninsula JLT2003]
MSRRGPVLIEEDAVAAQVLSPADAPPVADAGGTGGQAMQTIAALAARPPTFLGRWFWRSAAALGTFTLGLMAWSALAGLLERSALLGTIASVLLAVFAATLFGICLRELAALARLNRMGRLHREAAEALASDDLGAARSVTDRLTTIYAGRPGMDPYLERLTARREDVMDADALFRLTEAELLAPLDAAARIEVEAAARQVAAVTAVVPLAFADVAVALAGNLRMIRRIAEIYGGRAGTLGSWRLTRAVLTHLVATGAVAVGDDLIGSVAGGSMLSRVSRRFGEGVVNGALTARVGVAAIEVCRPLPFAGGTRPQVHKLVGRALTGLFPQSKRDG